MTIKARFQAGKIEYWESTTHQRVHAVAPMVFREQFHGHTLDVTNRWTALSVGTGVAPAIITAIGGGALHVGLDSTSEAQDSGVFMNDVRQFDLNAGLVVDFRFKTIVVPTSGTRVVIGMAANHNLDKDTVVTSAWFSMDGDGELFCETDDTTNDESTTSGTTLTTSAFRTGRMDFTNIADVRFYLDGASVATGTTFDMSNLTSAEAIMQPYIMCDKASGSSLGQLYVTDITIFSDET